METFRPSALDLRRRGPACGGRPVRGVFLAGEQAQHDAATTDGSGGGCLIWKSAGRRCLYSGEKIISMKAIIWRAG